MISVVVQGNITPWTREYLERFKENPLISEVILSTWENEDVRGMPNVCICKSAIPDNPGMGNRNLQLVSSRNGMTYVKNEYCIKIRSDMYVTDLDNMINFFIHHYEARTSQIYTLSIYPKFPFHPRDHLFMGRTHDLFQLFNIPLDTVNRPYNQFTEVRSETYIGMYYYSKFNHKIMEFIKQPEEYLVDYAPRR